jgi:hypothetical protein
VRCQVEQPRRVFDALDIAPFSFGDRQSGPPAKGAQLTALAAKSAHRVTGVASFILLTDIGDQHLRALHLDFEGSDQRVFRVNDNVSRLPLKFIVDRKLHLCSAFNFKDSTIQQVVGGSKP